jgi:hypothetical protein
MALLGVSGGMMETTFNNYVADVFHLGADARGRLEFPRELPGFLTALLPGSSSFFRKPASRPFPPSPSAPGCSASPSSGRTGARSWGHHPLEHRLPPAHADPLLHHPRSGRHPKPGRRLGQIAATSIAASIAGCAIVWISMRWFRANYTVIFAVGAATAFARRPLPLRHAYAQRPPATAAIHLAQ